MSPNGNSPVVLRLIVSNLRDRVPRLVQKLFSKKDFEKESIFKYLFISYEK